MVFSQHISILPLLCLGNLKTLSQANTSLFHQSGVAGLYFVLEDQLEARPPLQQVVQVLCILQALVDLGSEPLGTLPGWSTSIVVTASFCHTVAHCRGQALALGPNLAHSVVTFGPRGQDTVTAGAAGRPVLVIVLLLMN